MHPKRDPRTRSLTKYETLHCNLRVPWKVARRFVGGPRSPPFGLFLCTRFRNQKIRKSENQKMEPQKWFPWRGTTPVQITEMGSEKLFLWRTWGDLNFRDAATSGTNHRNVSAQEFPIFRNFPWQLCSGGPKVGDRWGRPSDLFISGCLVCGGWGRKTILVCDHYFSKKYRQYTSYLCCNPSNFVLLPILVP